MDHPRRIAPLPDAAGQHLGKAEPAFGRAQQDQAAVGKDQIALEIGGHLLALYGWTIEWEKAIFGHGGRGAFVVSGEMRVPTNFYPMSTSYAMSAIESSPIRKQVGLASRIATPLWFSLKVPAWVLLKNDEPRVAELRLETHFR